MCNVCACVFVTRCLYQIGINETQTTGWVFLPVHYCYVNAVNYASNILSFEFNQNGLKFSGIFPLTIQTERYADAITVYEMRNQTTSASGAPQWGMLCVDVCTCIYMCVCVCIMMCVTVRVSGLVMSMTNRSLDVLESTRVDDHIRYCYYYVAVVVHTHSQTDIHTHRHIAIFKFDWEQHKENNITVLSPIVGVGSTIGVCVCVYIYIFIYIHIYIYVRA